MDSRSLNRVVEIRQMSTDQDETGQPTQVWTLVARVWANILHQSGAESIRADKDTSVVKASIRIRRRPGVTAAMRVYHEGTVYEIKAVLPDEAEREKTDLACEVVNG